MHAPFWKSRAADLLHRIGRSGDSSALNGLNNPQPPAQLADERLSSEWREEAELRGPSRKPLPRSFILRTLRIMLGRH